MSTTVCRNETVTQVIVQPRSTPTVIGSDPCRPCVPIEINVPGPRGIPGGEAIVTAVAAAVVHGHRVVKIVGGLVYEVDQQLRADMALAAGVSITSAAPTESLAVRIDGTLDELSWSWVPGPIYAGVDGQLTQSFPTTGWAMEVARAISSTRIIVDFQLGVWRGN